MRATLLCAVLACTMAVAQTPKVYRIDSNAGGPSPLSQYDPATMSWTTLANVPRACTTTLASDGTDVFCLAEDGVIYRYDPVPDVWVVVQPGPAASVGRNNISFLETFGGEFYWGKDGTSTFHYTVGGVWSSMTAPTSVSSGSDVDVANGLIYVRTYSQLGFFAFDPSTATFPIVCTDATSVGENSRTGVFIQGDFYTREWSQPLQRFDVATCVKTDTMAALVTVHSSTCTDGNVIYLNSYGDMNPDFEVFDPVSGTATTLPGAPLYPGNQHPSMAFVGIAELAQIRVVTAVATPVPPGATALAVSFTAENVGTALVDVTSVDLSFTSAGMSDVTAEYTVTPSPANPATIGLGGTEVFDFLVDVSAMATLGTITVDGVLDVYEPASMIATTDTTADVTDTIEILGARIEVRTVDALPDDVYQGGTGYGVTVSVENTGLNGWNHSGSALSFVGTADRTSEYTVTPDPSNPLSIAPAAQEIFFYTVGVDPAATAETVNIDASFDGQDAVSGALVSDLGADTIDSWNVIACGAILCGDCTGDGIINIVDGLFAAQHGVTLITLTGTDFTNCNVTGLVEPDPGAVVTVLDALTIAQYAAGLPVILTCC